MAISDKALVIGLIMGLVIGGAASLLISKPKEIERVTETVLGPTLTETLTEIVEEMIYETVTETISGPTVTVTKTVTTTPTPTVTPVEESASLTIMICWTNENITKLELEDIQLYLKDRPEIMLLNLESWSSSKNNTELATVDVPIFAGQSVIIFKGNYDATYRFYSEDKSMYGEMIVSGTFEKTIIISEDTIFYEWWG